MSSRRMGACSAVQRLPACSLSVYRRSCVHNLVSHGVSGRKVLLGCERPDLERVWRSSTDEWGEDVKEEDANEYFDDSFSSTGYEFLATAVALAAGAALLKLLWYLAIACWAMVITAFQYSFVAVALIVVVVFLGACETCLSQQQHAAVNAEATKELANSIDATSVEKGSRKFRYPLKFSSMEQEITFLALMRLLEFGSGYDSLLKDKKEKTAKDVVQGPLSEWTNRLTSAIKVAGASLDSCGYESLGNLIIETMKDCTASGRPARASHLVSELVDNIPGFADSPSICGNTIPFARKAQLLAADLYCRFSEESPLFKFEDAASIGPDTGAAAICYLRNHGCLDCSSEVSKAISDGVELQRGDKEGSLRAACDVATRLLAAELGVDAWLLSRWIQLFADKPEGCIQHITRSTPAY